MRPRGQTPRMHATGHGRLRSGSGGFNEAAGADPADACRAVCLVWRFRRFNEAAGADPADAPTIDLGRELTLAASMRPRGQTPRMPSKARRCIA